MEILSSINNGQFSRNVLAVGKTGCEKTHFLQKLGLNKFFSNSVKTAWVSSTDIDEEREAEMQSCFTNKTEFHSAKEPDELIDLIEKFKLRTRDIVNVKCGFGEKITMDCLIVMDNVSGIADNCKKYAEFLTVCRKYRYHCIYVFHIIAPEGQIWKKVLSQTNIFNIFPSSVPYNTVAKILQSNCRQTTKKYAPACSVWLDRVFADLANTDEWHCLTIDCSGINKNGPGSYRTQADDPEKQVCCFNKPRDDALYNVFISNRMKTENFSNEIYFKLDGVQGKDETFDAKQTLKQDGIHDRFSKPDTNAETTAEFHGRGRKREHE